MNVESDGSSAPSNAPRLHTSHETAPVRAVKHQAHDLDKAPGMRRLPNAAVDRSGVHLVGGLVEREFNWIFRDQPIEDYGIDAQLEVVTDDSRVTGRLVGLQIKSGSSYFKEVERSKTEPGWNFYANSSHLSYWLQHSLPVIVVINDPNTSDAYFQVVTQRLVEETTKGFNLFVPETNRFNASSTESILRFVADWRDLESSLDQSLDLLPPNCAKVLQRASSVDKPSAARLADILSAGRTSPDLTAAALIAAQPSWIVTSQAEQDLWIAIGNYSNAHDFERVAADAFWLASECDGDRTARALAVTGLCLVQFDRAAAKPFLESARDQGQVLLADVGLAAIDIPLDDARSFDIPQSMIDATDEELDAEPSVLNFLAEMALRSGDYLTAIDYRERATVGDEPDPTMSLMLAQTVWRYAREEGGHFPTLKRRALALTRQAIEERRRWDGPSAEALIAHLDIQLTAGFNEDAVRSALPASEGGTARALEASSPGVARRGAIAALATDRTDAYDFFMRLLTGTPAEREIKALKADEGSPNDDPAAIDRWRAVLENSTEDEMKARAISRLVFLGDWPPQADDMISRSIFPDTQAAILRAIHRAQSGTEKVERDLGMAQLRQLARTNTMAALNLVILTDANIGQEAAIAECDTQLQRWADPALVQLLFSLCRQIDDLDRAAEIASEHVENDSLPVEIRQQMCRGQVSYLAKQGRTLDAISAAERGLAIGPDSDLAWNLVTLLARAGNLSRARAELSRHKPEPATEQETRLWLDLHLGVPLTATDARTMLGLAEQHASSPLGQGILRLLCREVLVNADAVSYPASLVTAVAERFNSNATLRDAPQDFSDESVRDFFAAGPLSRHTYQELIANIRLGRESHHGAAVALSQPYGWALLQHVSGVQVAFDLEPMIRIAGGKAAAQALDGSACVADLSAFRTLSLLPGDVADFLRGRLSSISTTADTSRDATRTRELMRGVASAPSVIAISSSGEATREVVQVADRLSLADSAARLEREVSLAETHTTEGRSLLLQVQNLSTATGLPVWCDESHSRQALRARGIACFSTLELFDAVRAAGTQLSDSRILVLLGSARLADLPLSGAQVVRIAEQEHWQVGSANVVLAQASWWNNQWRSGVQRGAQRQPDDWATNWQDDWYDIALAAAKHSYLAVLTLTGAALIGLCQSVTASRRTQVYQQLVVRTLSACHSAGLQEASQLLWGLSQDEPNPGLPPEPAFVMKALAAELRAAGVPDPEVAAWNLTGQPQIPNDG